MSRCTENEVAEVVCRTNSTIICWKINGNLLIYHSSESITPSIEGFYFQTIPINDGLLQSILEINVSISTVVSGIFNATCCYDITEESCKTLYLQLNNGCIEIMEPGKFGK